MTTTQAYKPSEGKREEFRKYLEKAGIMDALTKVLVNLYEEIDKPEDALTYIIDKLALQAGLETHKQLNEKLEEMNAQCKSLESELETLRSELPQDQPEGVEGEAPPAVEQDASTAEGAGEPPVEATEEPPPIDPDNPNSASAVTPPEDGQ